MNTLQLIQEKSTLINALVEKFKTKNPRVFGSVAHNLDSDTSDIDFLVDPNPTTTLFDLGALQQELEAVLGRPVDLLTPNDLPSKFKQEVLQTAIAI